MKTVSYCLSISLVLWFNLILKLECKIREKIRKYQTSDNEESGPDMEPLSNIYVLWPGTRYFLPMGIA